MNYVNFNVRMRSDIHCECSKSIAYVRYTIDIHLSKVWKSLNNFCKNKNIKK